MGNIFDFAPYRNAFTEAFDQCLESYKKCVEPVNKKCHEEALSVMGSRGEIFMDDYNKKKRGCGQRPENKKILEQCDQQHPVNPCVEKAETDHQKEILDWLKYIDIYSALRWNQKSVAGIESEFSV